MPVSGSSVPYKQRSLHPLQAHGIAVALWGRLQPIKSLTPPKRSQRRLGPSKPFREGIYLAWGGPFTTIVKRLFLGARGPNTVVTEEARAMANEEHLARLKQGVDVWNRRRKEHRDVRPNLTMANLSGTFLPGHVSTSRTSLGQISPAQTSEPQTFSGQIF